MVAETEVDEMPVAVVVICDIVDTTEVTVVVVSGRAEIEDKAISQDLTSFKSYEWANQKQSTRLK